MKKTFCSIFFFLALAVVANSVFLNLNFEEQANLLSCKVIAQTIMGKEKSLIIKEFSEQKEFNRTLIYDKSYWYLVSYCLSHLNEEILKEAYKNIGNQENLLLIVNKYLPESLNFIQESNNFTFTEEEIKIRELYRIEKEEIIVESQPNKNNVDFLKGSVNTWFQFNNNFMLYLSLAILTTMFYIVFKHLSEQEPQTQKKKGKKT